VENYQKNMLNPKKDGASRYPQPLLTYSEKSKMAAAAILKKSKNRHISAAF